MKSLFLSLALLLCVQVVVGSEVNSNTSYSSKRFAKLSISAVLWIWSESQKSKLSSNQCRWCDPPAIDTYVRGQLKWKNTKTAGQISDLLAFGILPATSILGIYYLEEESSLKESYFILGEAVVYSSLLNQMSKFLVSRERPFVHELTIDEKNRVEDREDNNLSFYSGHTNFAFAIATVMSRTFLTRKSTSQWLKGVALGASALVGYLRIAADKHYFTDVAVGALSGAAFAYSLTEKEPDTYQILFTPGTIYFTKLF